MELSCQIFPVVVYPTKQWKQRVKVNCTQSCKTSSITHSLYILNSQFTELLKIQGQTFVECCLNPFRFLQNNWWELLDLPNKHCETLLGFSKLCSQESTKMDFQIFLNFWPCNNPTRLLSDSKVAINSIAIDLCVQVQIIFQCSTMKLKAAAISGVQVGFSFSRPFTRMTLQSSTLLLYLSSYAITWLCAVTLKRYNVGVVRWLLLTYQPCYFCIV